MKKTNKPIFEITKKEFEDYKFRDANHHLIKIGDKLKNMYGSRFEVIYCISMDEVSLSCNCRDGYNLNAIQFLEKIK